MMRRRFVKRALSVVVGTMLGVIPIFSVYSAEVKGSASEARPVCEDRCGDKECQEIVCKAVGCPCAETAESCPADCGDHGGGE